MSNELYKAVFPSDFLFGACISDYQHFGKTVCDLPPNNGSMHIERYKEDFELAKSLNLNSIRTSVEWSRIEPRMGEVDKGVLDFYKEYFSTLKSNGLKSFVTLHHFSNPKWIHELGGWLSQDVSKRFLTYVEFVARELCEFIDFALLFNEPGVYAFLAYYKGEKGLPPYEKNFSKLVKALENIKSTLIQASDVLRSYGFKGKIGFPSFVPNTHPVSSFSLRARVYARQAWSNLFYDVLDETSPSVDFIGVDYYTKNFVDSTGRIVFSTIEPEALTRVLATIYLRYKKPVAVLENGLATRNDALKTRYLVDHLYSVYKAIEAGVPVLCYLWWSFLHGYEWEGYGYQPFFALVDVGEDYTRKPTQTAQQFSEIARTRIISVDLLHKVRETSYPKKIKDWRLLDQELQVTT